VIAFFIIPPAAAYLLTDRLSVMLLLSAVIGSVGVFFGYDLARGSFLGILQVNDLLAWLNQAFGLGLIEEWNSSISASMVLMIFFFFMLAWLLSPKYGVVSTIIRRADQRRRFDNQVVLGHIYNHRETDVADEELAADGLHEHFHWSQAKMIRVLTRLRTSNLIRIANNSVQLTTHGETRIRQFRQQNLIKEFDA